MGTASANVATDSPCIASLLCPELDVIVVGARASEVEVDTSEGDIVMA
jgi:hypothetical protein